MLIPDYTDLHNAHKHIIHDIDQCKQALQESKVKDVHNVNEGKVEIHGGSVYKRKW